MKTLCHIEVVEPKLYKLFVEGIIDPAIAMSPTMPTFAIGVVVPIPNLPLVLSQNSEELFCDNRPPVPTNGIDPAVNDV